MAYHLAHVLKRNLQTSWLSFNEQNYNLVQPFQKHDFESQEQLLSFPLVNFTYVFKRYLTCFFKAMQFSQQ